MTPVEYIYYLLYRIHRQYGLKRRRRLNGRTISIGNLTIGGTGKTPLTIEIAREAAKRGFNTCILTRGYRGDAKGCTIVSKGEGPLVSWQQCGDEPFLMAERLKNVWIVKDHNRYRGGLISGERDIYILDDGFQHWRLHRDIDIVIIDATDPFGRRRLLPLGRLREPVEEIKRATIILINRTDKKNPVLEAEIRRYNKEAPIFYSTYTPEALVKPDGTTVSIETLVGKEVFAFSGIGNPSQFIKLLESLGLIVTGSLSFRDHHIYTERDIRRIETQARKKGTEILITTEKDLLKLKPLRHLFQTESLFALRIRLELFDKKFYDILFRGMKEHREPH